MENAPLSVSDIESMKVDELKKQLSARGLDVKGLKKELVSRLVSAVSTQSPSSTVPAGQDSQAAPTASSAPSAPAPANGIAEPASEPAAAATVSEESAPPADTPSESYVSPLELSEEDRKKLRAERFGIPLTQSTPDAEKKRARAERFGLSTTAESTAKKSSVADDEAARQRRAERFGTKQAVSADSDPRSADRLKRRQERFQPESAEEAAKKKQRLARFGLDVKP